MAEPVTEARVRALLNEIVDPCSAAAGAPAGLADMGLVRSVIVEQGSSGATIRVVLGITEPGCLMSLPFQNSAHQRLDHLDGVAKVEVTFDPTLQWTEDDLSPEYARRLTEVRRARRESLTLVKLSTRPGLPGLRGK
ncbi:hypothetical protein [Nocardia sp. NPDC004123]